MRFATRFLISILCFSGALGAAGQAPEVIEAARVALAPAFPALRDATPSAIQLLPRAATSALGCDLIAGLRLPAPTEAYRLLFPLDDRSFAVHVSADGSLAQPCDEHFPNLGSGTLPVGRQGSDGDGDGLPDSADGCAWIAGLMAADRPGCPQPSASDRDGDGVRDSRDRCPDQAGAGLAEGCALLRDEDGDGSPDHIDICPADFGAYQPELAAGCPADGSGNSSSRRGNTDLCLVDGDGIPLYSERSGDAAVIAIFDAATSTAAARAISGRTAAADWYQLAKGWVQAADAQLRGACYNIPLVNPVIGGATGCVMRPRGDTVNVREGPRGQQVGRLGAGESQTVLGANFAGDWLFFRAGWVTRALVELAGACDQLPILDPARVASGTVDFCPPGYAGYLPPRIGIGRETARIASPTLANRLRTRPHVSAEQIGEIPPGRTIDAVLDGPACNDTYIWWQVEVDSQVGWTVESDTNFNYYYLEPTGSERATGPAGGERGPSERELPAANRLIHSVNAAHLDTVRSLPIGSPRAIAWSPLRSILAIIDGRGEIALFSYPDAEPIGAALQLPRSTSATAIAFSPDERHIAIGQSDGALIVAELADPAASDQAERLAGPIRALAWSPSGEALAAISGDGRLKIARRAGSLLVWGVKDDSRSLYHYTYPYPLSAVAFSADGKWLAAGGASSGDQRAGLWIYAADSGDLVLSKALIYAGEETIVRAAPAEGLGDFVYSSGDSLFQIELETREDIRFFHLAGARLRGLAIRRQVTPGAEALLALSARGRDGSTRLHIINALSPYAPVKILDLAPDAIAFSPDGRRLAALETRRDRVLLLGVPAA